jgi:hypothetical protein
MLKMINNHKEDSNQQVNEVRELIQDVDKQYVREIQEGNGNYEKKKATRNVNKNSDKSNKEHRMVLLADKIKHNLQELRDMITRPSLKMHRVKEGAKYKLEA